MDKHTKHLVLDAQRMELTEHYVYAKLAKRCKNPSNKKLLQQLSDIEMVHHDYWKNCSGEDVKPFGFKKFKYNLFSRLFGFTFAIRLMEQEEDRFQAKTQSVQKICKVIPGAQKHVDTGAFDENKIINKLKEQRVGYIGSVVLGLNDALVELTGALAGLTLALQHTQLIAVVGLITGVAASLSMAASEFLSLRAEQSSQNPFKGAWYTGIAYIVVVLLLILPYWLMVNPFKALASTIGIALLIIFSFSYYISVTKELSFKKRFVEMFALSMGVAAITFAIGYLIRMFLNVEI